MNLWFCLSLCVCYWNHDYHWPYRSRYAINMSDKLIRKCAIIHIITVSVLDVRAIVQIFYN